jgi:small subunit ribosomal protein S8
MMTDPVGDMLTRIRNAGMARHLETRCPASKLKRSVANVLQSSGFIGEIRVEAEDGHTHLVMEIRYDELGAALIDGIRRVSKPGRRVYVGKAEVPTVRHGLGVAVLSTSKGILSDVDARAASVGGEVLCEVW